MNKVSRTVLAFFSTLLLAAGFARAAESLDPISIQLVSTASSSSLVPEEPPVAACMSCDYGAN